MLLSIRAEKVVCIINTDYGAIESLPFDLRQQRVTPYSLFDNDKQYEKKKLRDIISGTILELSQKESVQKNGKAYHIVGSYDAATKTVNVNNMI